MRYEVTQADDNDQFYVMRDGQEIVAGPWSDRGYALRAAEELSFTAPGTMTAEIRQGQREGVWKPCAAKLGWYWSSAHGGYINEGQRDQGLGWDSYRVQEDVEDACFASGVETLEQALAMLD